MCTGTLSSNHASGLAVLALCPHFCFSVSVGSGDRLPVLGYSYSHFMLFLDAMWRLQNPAVTMRWSNRGGNELEGCEAWWMHPPSCRDGDGIDCPAVLAEPEGHVVTRGRDVSRFPVVQTNSMHQVASVCRGSAQSDDLE